MKDSVYNRLTEHFVNLVTDNEKQQYLDVIYPLIEDSYSKVGGFPTAKEDLIADTDLWKLIRRNGKIVAGQLFKDRLGRKMICGFTDGTTQGKIEFKNLIKHLLTTNRGWVEASGSVERIITEYLAPLPNTKAAMVLKKLGKDVELVDDGIHYQREIGGVQRTKAMFGTPEVEFDENYEPRSWFKIFL
jgi:hypothetical protein